ncbi:hypothetical protein RN001_010959 [Aquatica leii]|uniref:C2H2-type domain-containing protein n=1 Tax=Aquatica leii TaxID=1421715 RepID=A0AAN7P8J4_9COLE|nr:hypothetical protein RN001_010959 [Aquatica leii]
MLGPLAFDTTSLSLTNEDTQCLMCCTKYNLKQSLPSFLKHIFDIHHIVIEKPQHIDDFALYLSHWRERFKKTPIEQIIPAVIVKPSNHKYFVLSDLLKEDKVLRHKLKLEAMLRTQEFEREDTTFKTPCLFCKLMFEGKRSCYLTHLSNDHNVRLGNPQNLVYVDDLLKQIEKKLNLLQCLYCEKTFTDRNVLKDHMRKKQHKRINPNNRFYDKYYAVTYLEDHQCNTHVEDLPLEENSDREYADWNESELTITCLFCSHSDKDISNVCLHMNSKHRFNFYNVSKHLDFYQKVKLVNYIRRQIHCLHCIYCDESLQDRDSLEMHLKICQQGHLPDSKLFDQPEFYFPTFENDCFLHYLDDIDD